MLALDAAGLNCSTPATTPSRTAIARWPTQRGVASLVRMPAVPARCTAGGSAAAVEPVRYTLWDEPHRRQPRRLIGADCAGAHRRAAAACSTHLVDEYIGSDLVEIAISFVDLPTWPMTRPPPSWKPLLRRRPREPAPPASSKR